jgi:hypothetical protein
MLWMPLMLVGWIYTGHPAFKVILWAFVIFIFLISAAYVIYAFAFTPKLEVRERWRKMIAQPEFKQQRQLGLVLMVFMLIGLFRYVNSSIGTVYLCAVILLQVGRVKLIGNLR